MTTITPLPTPPSRDDPENFSDRADAFLPALVVFGAEANALASEVNAAAETAINAPGTSATSTTSLAIGTGSKTLTVQTGKDLVPGQAVMIANTGAVTNFMHGQITAYNSGTGSLTVAVSATSGTGTYSAWTVSLSLAQLSVPASGGAFTGPVSGTSWSLSGRFSFTSGASMAGTDNNRWALFNSGTVNERVSLRPDGAFQIAGARNIGNGDVQGSGNALVFAKNAGGYALSLYDTQAFKPIQFVVDIAGTPNEAGTITCTNSTVSYNTSSDYRLKEIDGPILNSGAFIDALNPVQGRWKVDGSRFIGLIAHEVQAIAETPIATGAKDGEQMQGMAYASPELIAHMIAELKSLRARVADLEAA